MQMPKVEYKEIVIDDYSMYLQCSRFEFLLKNLFIVVYVCLCLFHSSFNADSEACWVHRNSPLSFTATSVRMTVHIHRHKCT